MLISVTVPIVLNVSRCKVVESFVLYLLQFKLFWPFVLRLSRCKKFESIMLHLLHCRHEKAK